MSILRRFCNSGAAVLCAAAVSRQKSASGSTYCGLNLASFRGSSELEFGADACYLLVPDADGPGVAFQCEKNRYGPMEGFRTTFDPTYQSFTEATEPTPLERFDAATPAPARKSGRGVSSFST